MVCLEQVLTVFEVCSTVSLDINGSLASISDFDKDIMSKVGSDSSGTSLHDSSKSDTNSNYNTERSILQCISNFFILQPKRVVAILYSRDSN